MSSIQFGQNFGKTTSFQLFFLSSAEGIHYYFVSSLRARLEVDSHRQNRHSFSSLLVKRG